MIKLAALLLATLTATGFAMGRRTPKKTPEDKSMEAAKSAAADVTPNEWRAAFCAEARPSARIIESGAEWDRLWQDSLKQPAPEVDFSKHVAAVVFLGSQPTGGYTVEFLEPLSDGVELLLRYRVRAPTGMVIQAFTQPYAIKLYKKTGLKVSLAEAKG